MVIQELDELVAELMEDILAGFDKYLAFEAWADWRDSQIT